MNTIQIWVEYKFGKCPIHIGQEIKKRKYDFYLLCDVDIPWSPDAQRENPFDQQELLKIYKHYLDFYEKDYVLINGPLTDRHCMAHKILGQRFIILPV